jgi:hypothetical protein
MQQKEEEKRKEGKQEKKRKLAFRKGYLLLFPCSIVPLFNSISACCALVSSTIARSKDTSARGPYESLETTTCLSVCLSLDWQFPQRKQTQQEMHTADRQGPILLCSQSGDDPY